MTLPIMAAAHNTVFCRPKWTDDDKARKAFVNHKDRSHSEYIHGPPPGHAACFGNVFDSRLDAAFYLATSGGHTECRYFRHSSVTNRRVTLERASCNNSSGSRGMTCTMPSSDPVARCRPSGLKSKSVTPALWVNLNSS